MATSSSAPAAAAGFLNIPPSPKRPREEESEEVSWTAEAQAWTCSIRNMNINIRSVAGSMSLLRGTGEPPRSTSQHHLPDCSAELWRTQQHSKKPQLATAEVAKSRFEVGISSHDRHNNYPPLALADWRPAHQRWPWPGTGNYHRWVVQEREPPGRGAKAGRAAHASKLWPPTLIFRHARPPDRPPPTPSDTHGRR
jgi:hypothetical protein